MAETVVQTVPSRSARDFLAFVRGPALGAMVLLVLLQEAAGAVATW